MSFIDQQLAAVKASLISIIKQRASEEGQLVYFDSSTSEHEDDYPTFFAHVTINDGVTTFHSEDEGDPNQIENTKYSSMDQLPLSRLADIAEKAWVAKEEDLELIANF